MASIRQPAPAAPRDPATDAGAIVTRNAATVEPARSAAPAAPAADAPGRSAAPQA